MTVDQSMVSIITGVLFFSMVMLSLGTYFNAVQTTYYPNGTLNSTLFSGYNRTINSLNTSVQDMGRHTTGFVNKEWYDIAKYQDAVLLFLKIGVVIMKFPGIIISTLYNTLSILPIPFPRYSITVFVTIIVLVFVMRVAAIFTKTDEI